MNEASGLCISSDAMIVNRDTPAIPSLCPILLGLGRQDSLS